MTDPSASVYTVRQVRELDRLAIQEGGIPGYDLMTRAAEAGVAAIRSRWPGACRWLILCGAGNNAGDGYAVARLARAAGLDVTVMALADPASLGGDAATAWEDFRKAGGGAMAFDARRLDGADIVVDALLGTGLDRPLEGVWREAVAAINAQASPVVSLDLPSGLHGDTGAVLGAAVRAALTVSFVGHKSGAFLGEGPAHVGELVFDGLGIPDALRNRVTPVLRRFTAADLARLLGRRHPMAHKGQFGHVLVVGGQHGMVGAVRLAGEAALRSGAGLVTVATRGAHAPLIAMGRPELMAHGVEEPAALAPLLSRATVLAVGPGLGQADWSRKLLEACIAAPQPKVLDADALNLLAAAPCQRQDWILTPHPGEAARLLGQGTGPLPGRLETLAALAERYGGTIILKGSRTLVGTRRGLPWVIDRGNPGMATAGMGDVLTGITAGLVAQRGQVDAETAAAAAWIHAAAGDAAARSGERGIIAGDVLAELRPWLNPTS